MMRRWLARLSFALLIIAIVVVWETFVALQRPGGVAAWRVYLQVAVAALCAVLGMVGVRIRHQDKDGKG